MIASTSSTAIVALSVGLAASLAAVGWLVRQVIGGVRGEIDDLRGDLRETSAKLGSVAEGLAGLTGELRAERERSRR